MSVLDRSALEASPLADLHTIASELSIDGYRRLRKAELIDVIVEKQGGSAPKRRSRRKASDSDAAGPAKTETTESETTESETAESEDVKPETARPARSRTRARAKPKADEADAPEAEAEATETEGSDEDEADSGPRRRRGRRGGRGRSASRDNGDTGTTAEAEESTEAEERSRRGGGRRGRRGVAGQRVWLRPRRSARALRRRRLHLLGAGQALRARLRGPDRGPQARAATLRAFRLADPDRDDQRPPGSRARRQRPVRRSPGGVCLRAASSSAPRTRRSRRSSS